MNDQLLFQIFIVGSGVLICLLFAINKWIAYKQEKTMTTEISEYEALEVIIRFESKLDELHRKCIKDLIALLEMKREILEMRRSILIKQHML